MQRGIQRKNIPYFREVDQFGQEENRKDGDVSVEHFCTLTGSFVLNMSYENLHDQANNHYKMRHLMDVDKGFGFDRVEFEYQNIYNNVSGKIQWS